MPQMKGYEFKSIRGSIAIKVDGDFQKLNSNTIVICRSKLLAQQNKIDDAIAYFTRNITFFTEESKYAFCEKLKHRELD